MLKYLIFSIVLLGANIVSGQSSEPILTKEHNASWIASLNAKDLSRQLEIVKTRWEEDVKIYFKASADAHGLKNVTEEEKRKTYEFESRCRPLYLINKEEGDPIFFPANPSPEKVGSVSKLLTSENISEVKVASEKIQMLYGQHGSCGVINITVAKNGIFDKIEELLQEKE